MNNVLKVEDFQIIEGRDIYGCMKLIREENPIPVFQKMYLTTHVFDENKSVKWNREEVDRQNQQIQDNITRARNVRNESEKNLDRAVINYVMGESGYGVEITENLALNIINFAKEVHEDTWWEWLDDVIDYTVRVLNCSKRRGDN